jgi:CheY-like chemotaxis protein
LLTGTEAVRILRTRGCESVICGLSANNLASVFESAGADMFHQKPFPYVPNDLITLLVELVRKRRHIAATECFLTTSAVSERLVEQFCAAGRHVTGKDENGDGTHCIEDGLSLPLGGTSPSLDSTPLPKLHSVRSSEYEDILPQHLSVLFCDDDRTLRRLAVRAVKNILPDCRVQEANSGESALLLCESQEFDLIFMDQYMVTTSSSDSVLLGSQTVQELRRRLGCKSVIVGVSANQQEEAFIAAGANHFWLKPFPCQASSLRQALAGILSNDNSMASIEGLLEV